MMPSRDRSSSTSIILALLIVGGGGSVLGANACSGKTENTTPAGSSSSGASGSSSGSTSSSGSSGTTDSKNNPACPASDPKEGACTQDGLLCEYGDDFNPLCNVIRVCSTNKWASPIFYSEKPTCPSTPPTVKANPAECAATRELVPEGTACSNSSDAARTTCSYDGSTCTCGVFCRSYPVAFPDCDPDAGKTDNCCDRTKVQWNCFDGPAFCKTPRPRVGSTCTVEGENCALTQPGECGQPKLACTKGIWTVPNTSCPISTARAKEEIAYVDRDGADRLHDQMMSTRLATYRYKKPAPEGYSDGQRHLGFIIEDMPEGSAAVMPSRERVDLYGYASMTVASLQHQQREIDALKTELARLREENAAMKRRQPHGQ